MSDSFSPLGKLAEKAIYFTFRFRELWSSSSRVDRAHLWTAGM